MNKLRKYVLIFSAVWACAVFLGRFSGTLIPCDVPEGACRNPGIHGKVLVLVPHEDDEINLMGGVFELLRDDCEIWVVFSTNGVGTGKPVRNAEACRALAQFGIPADHVIFLGFDVMPLRGAGTHLYNRPRNEVTTSPYGRDATWSPSGFPCHAPNLPYTQANFEGDIKDIIAAMKPEHIFITGYDLHSDHRALDLSAKRALAVVMKENPAYRPEVYSGFAYSDCWYQEPDFYDSVNIGSTKHLNEGEHMEEVNCLLWRERLRLPVGAGSITRTLMGNLTVASFRQHDSQGHANIRIFERISNGDRVYWWIPTQNAALFAQVSANGERVDQLNDFLLYDSTDISNPDRMPFDNGWRPQGGRGTVEFTWDSPIVIREIHLFDHPDEANQITRLTIRLSNGKTIPVTDLPKYGNRFIVETMCSEPISGFSLTIDESTGEGSGLSEVEAYTSHPQSTLRVAKLQDADGNFMYDYITGEDGQLRFSLYTWGCSADGITVKVKETGEVVQKDGDSYSLNLPQGEACTLRVTDSAGATMDEARISNPSSFKRSLITLARAWDRHVVDISRHNQIRYYKELIKWGYLPLLKGLL